MNQKESSEIAAYAAAVRLYRANAIMCHLMPGDEFEFPYSETKFIARKAGWYHRKDSPKCAYRTGRLTAVIRVKYAEQNQ
jgi:hypothetical protein